MNLKYQKSLRWHGTTKPAFDAIERQFGLSEAGDVIKLMRLNMKPSSFRMWRIFVSGRKTKHGAILTRCLPKNMISD